MNMSSANKSYRPAISLLTAVLVITLLSTKSCQNLSEHEEIRIDVSFENAVNLLNSEIFESAKVVSLESDGGGLIGEIAELVVHDGDIFIFDRTKLNAVYRFSNEGDHLSTYGSAGRGPGEYSNINSFSLDKNNNIVELLVSPNHILTYDVDGQLLNEFRNPNQVPALSFAKAPGGNYYLYGGHNNGFDKYRLYYVNNSGDIINKHLSDDSNLLPFGGNSNFFRFGDTIYLREETNNHIYKLINNSKAEKFYFDFKEYNFPDNIPGDYHMSLERFAFVFNFFKNDHYLLATIYKNDQRNPMPGFYFMLKNLISGDTDLIKMPELTTFIESFVFPYYLTEGNEIVFVVNPSDLEINRDKLENSVFGNMQVSVDPDQEFSNPLLVFCRLKNK